MREDLKRSGLAEKDIPTKLLTAQQTNKLVGKSLASYQIIYNDINGKQTKFFRIRFLEQPDNTGSFSKQAKNQKQIRYTQPQGTGCSFYLPVDIDWEEISKDPSIPIYITEGEKKAVKACKCGFPTIGLGGVESFTSEGKLLPDFNMFEWDGRNIYVIYDSDQRNNVNVQRAQTRICRALTDIGAMPYVISLPDNSKLEKQGLDDFLVFKGAKELDKLVLDAVKFSEAEALFDMNNEYSVLKNPPVVLDTVGGGMYSANNFVNLIASNRRHFEITYKANKKGELVEQRKQTSTAKKWLEWNFRNEFDKIVYEPGCDEITENNYNVWRPSEVQLLADNIKKLKKGSLELYFKFRDYLMAEEPDYVDWLEQWIAYPIQYPGTKINIAVVFRSDAQGVGKSLLGQIIGRMYGNNFGVVTHKQIYQPFNAWAENKQFILGDEVSGTDKRDDTDYLKNLITNSSMEINRKNVPQYYINDYVNYIFTSNHVDALYLEQADRRFFIVDMGHRPPLPDEFYTKLDAWYKSDSVADLYYYFKNVVNVSKFNPQSRAPQTKSKESMIFYSKTATEQFVETLKADPNVISRVGTLELKGDLLTATDIVQRYNQTHPDSSRMNPTAMGKALKKIGFVQRHITNKKLRLYIIRNHDRWLKASYDEMYEHYTNIVLNRKVNDKFKSRTKKNTVVEISKARRKKK